MRVLFILLLLTVLGKPLTPYFLLITPLFGTKISRQNRFSCSKSHLAFSRVIRYPVTEENMTGGLRHEALHRAEKESLLCWYFCFY